MKTIRAHGLYAVAADDVPESEMLAGIRHRLAGGWSVGEHVSGADGRRGMVDAIDANPGRGRGEYGLLRVRWPDGAHSWVDALDAKRWEE